MYGIRVIRFKETNVLDHTEDVIGAIRMVITDIEQSQALSK
jgi:very-short-patch-repair endonuclease